MPRVPPWVTLCHVNTWLHPRFIPCSLPVVATLHHSVHDPVLRQYKGWLRDAYHRWWIGPNERRILHRADHVTAVSRFVADMARQSLCNVPMQVIYNGIDTEIYRPDNRKRRRDGPFRLLYVGGWKRLKGVDLLTPIMRELGRDFELHYTGGSTAIRYRQDMPANMRDLGRLSGHEVVAAMQSADAFLFPSRSEGLPLVVIEAMACGLPVIAVNCSSLAEVVEDAATGLLCPRENLSALVAAARSLGNDESVRLAMGISARRVAKTRFSSQQMVDAHVCMYRAIAHAHT